MALGSQRGMARRKVLLLLIVLAVAIGGWFIFGLQRESAAQNPKTAGDKFAGYLVARDSEQSYAMLADLFKTTTAQEDWKSWVESVFEGNPTFRFVEELEVHEPYETYPEGSTPTRLRYEFTVDGDTKKTNLVLVKDDEVWKISEIGGFE